VRLAQPTNVDTVVIDGRILRRGNKFIALERGKVVADAKEALAGLKTRAKWPG